MANEGEEYLKGMASPTELKRVLEFEVPRERVEAEAEDIIQGIRREVALPGFRKGKAPIDVIRARFGKTARKEAIDKLIPEAYEQALKKESLRPVLPAEISSLNYGDQGPLSFQISIELFPKIELGTLGGIKVKKEVKPVEPADVDRELASLHERLARFEKVEGQVEPAHVAILDYWRLDEAGEPVKASRVTNYPVEIGSGRLVKEFDQGLVGMKGGEAKTINVTYPDDFPDQQLRGKTVRFGVEVKQVTRKILPEMDDALAKTFGSESLDDLKGKIRQALERNAEQEAESKAKQELLKKVIDDNQFTVPEGLIGMMLESMMKSYREEPEGKSEAPGDEKGAGRLEEIRQRLTPLAVNLVKEQFVIDEIARREKITAKDEDIDEILGSIALRAGISKDEARSRAEKSEEVGRWRRDIVRNKVLDFLYKNADVQE
jgi:trigger factor